MKRREFISAAVAALLAPGAAARAAVAPGMRLGVQLHGVREACERDLAGTLAAIRAMGFEGVEAGRFFGLEPEAFGAAVRAAGLELVSLQLYPQHLAGAELVKTIRLCRECGARRVTSAWFKGSAENQNDWLLAAEVLNHAAEICANEGISVGYHNHDQEFKVEFNGRAAMDVLAGALSEKVTIEFDPGWCVLAGADAPGWFKANSNRVIDLHLTPAIADAAGLAPGQAGLGSTRDAARWQNLLPAFRRAGVEWAFVKPLSFPSSLADLESSMRFIRSRIPA